jgi:hypothetical protein
MKLSSHPMKLSYSLFRHISLFNAMELSMKLHRDWPSTILEGIQLEWSCGSLHMLPFI